MSEEIKEEESKNRAKQVKKVAIYLLSTDTSKGNRSPYARRECPRLWSYSFNISKGTFHACSLLISVCIIRTAKETESPSHAFSIGGGTKM
jgi:hypothetical protein